MIAYLFQNSPENSAGIYPWNLLFSKVAYFLTVYIVFLNKTLPFNNLQTSTEDFGLGRGFARGRQKRRLHKVKH